MFMLCCLGSRDYGGRIEGLQLRVEQQLRVRVWVLRYRVKVSWTIAKDCPSRLKAYNFLNFRRPFCG